MIACNGSSEQGGSSRGGPTSQQRNHLAGELAEDYYYKPTVLKGHNQMRVFQEEIFGPVLAVTTFKDEREAHAIANDTMYGLGAGVWTNCYHLVLASMPTIRAWSSLPTIEG